MTKTKVPFRRTLFHFNSFILCLFYIMSCSSPRLFALRFLRLDSLLIFFCYLSLLYHFLLFPRCVCLFCASCAKVPFHSLQCCLVFISSFSLLSFPFSPLLRLLQLLFSLLRELGHRFLFTWIIPIPVMSSSLTCGDLI